MTLPPDSERRPDSASESPRRPAILRYPDGTPLHWSEAAKYRYGLYPRSTSGLADAPPAEQIAAADDIAAAGEVEAQLEEPPVEPPVELEFAPLEEPEPQAEPQDKPEDGPQDKPEDEPPSGPQVEPALESTPEPKAPRVRQPASDRVPWSARVRILVLIVVLALAGVVIPFSLMNWESLDWSDWFGGSATTSPTSTTASTADQETSPDESAVEESAADDSASAEPADADESLLTPVSTDMVEGERTLVSYLIADVGLTVTAPEGWDPVSPNLLADCQADYMCLAGLVETEGPTLSGQFLNTITIRSIDVPEGASLTDRLVQDTTQRFVDEGPDSYDYFQLLTPTRTTTVGGMYSRMATARITWNDRVLVKSVYTFAGGGHLFQVELQTDDVAWDEYQDLFKGILDSFVIRS